MSIGRTFEESLLKALRSSEYDPAVDWTTVDDDELETAFLETPTPDRPYAMFEAFDRGYTVEAVVESTGIYEWYVERFKRIAEAAEAAEDGDFQTAADAGFTNQEVTAIAGGEFNDTHASWIPSEAADTDDDGESQRVEPDGSGVTVGDVEADTSRRTYKQVDTCAGEFRASTPYYYSAREPPTGRGESEVQVDRDVESVVVVGGGPIRIGQGVEFDYCAVHAVRALRDVGIDAHVVNNNPETVSTDYDTSDLLFFEPLTLEDALNLCERLNGAPLGEPGLLHGAIVQFGGQTPLNLARGLQAAGVPIIGTAVESIELAEDREQFQELLNRLEVEQPEAGIAFSPDEATAVAERVGYPVLVRPSYVLGGRGMETCFNRDQLLTYMKTAVDVSDMANAPVLIDRFLAEAVEVDVDVVADFGPIAPNVAAENTDQHDSPQALVCGIMEHIEEAGVHSGDSACAIPPYSLDQETIDRLGRNAAERAVGLAERSVLRAAARGDEALHRRAGRGRGLVQRLGTRDGVGVGASGVGAAEAPEPVQ